MIPRVFHLVSLAILSIDYASAAAEVCQAPITITAEQLLAISPAVQADAAACTAATNPYMQLDECAPAPVTAAGLTAALAAQNIMSIGRAAAGIVYMMSESSSFLFNHNHNYDVCTECEGRPGQGTYCMMMPDNLVKYAAANNVPANPDPEGLLKVLNAAPEHAFGTAFWFMTSQCEPAILPILDQGTAEGLKSFATCTGTGPDVIEKMNALYLKAVETLTCGGVAAADATDLVPPNGAVAQPTLVTPGEQVGSLEDEASSGGPGVSELGYLRSPPGDAAAMESRLSGSGSGMEEIEPTADLVAGKSGSLSDSEEEPAITKPILSKSAVESGSPSGSPSGSANEEDDGELTFSSGAGTLDGLAVLSLVVLGMLAV